MPEILEVPTEPTIPAQTPAPPTEPTGWMSPEGEFRNSAPENIRNLLEAKKWTNVGQMADAYAELEKFTGVGKHLVIPEVEDAEGWNNVYDVLGRPPTHDKYEVKYEGDIEVGEELIGSFKQFAHGLGLTQKQFNDVVNFQLDAVTAQTQAYETQAVAQTEANTNALKQKWGANYGAKVTGARIIADSLGIYNTLETKGLASDPDIIEMLDTIASRTAEDVITPPTPVTPAKSPLDEREEINKSDAYLNKFHPRHREAVNRVMELNQIIANSSDYKRKSR